MEFAGKILDSIPEMMALVQSIRKDMKVNRNNHPILGMGIIFEAADQ
jgi:hypothetical protein